MTSLQFRGEVPIGVGLVLAVCVAILSWRYYRQEIPELSPFLRWALPCMRSLAFFLGIMLLTLPFVIPLVEGMGLDLIWFGVVVVKLDRLRLRGLNGARDEFLLAATAQNLRRMAKLMSQPPPSRRIPAPA